MKDISIKTAVSNSLASVTFDSVTDKVIASCLLYNYVKLVMETESGNDAAAIASAYAINFKGVVSSLASSYISYSVMKSKIENTFKKTTFLSLTDDEIAIILSLYSNKREIVPFSTKRFSQFMYNETDLSLRQYNNLRNIHYNSMSLLIKYYVDTYGNSESDMHIISADVYPSNPGKGIIFVIDNILPSKIVSDIKTGIIPLDYYEVKTYGNYVKIIFK